MFARESISMPGVARRVDVVALGVSVVGGVGVGNALLAHSIVAMDL